MMRSSQPWGKETVSKESSSHLPPADPQWGAKILGQRIVLVKTTAFSSGRPGLKS